MKLTPMRAIRRKCLECCGGSAYEVKNCNITECPLFSYRFGERQKQSDCILKIKS